MNIRKIKRNEMPALLELYAHYTSNLIPISEEKSQQIWDEIEANPGISYFVLEVEGRIVSSCILSITPSIIGGGDGYAVIEHVVTHDEYRRKGFARAILEFALNCAWEHGCTETMLLSGAGNEGAHRLYESLGFDQHKRKGFIAFKP